MKAFRPVRDVGEYGAGYSNILQKKSMYRQAEEQYLKV